MAFNPQPIGPPQPIDDNQTGARPNPAIDRAARLRQFLQANPGRRPPPMGRAPDGSIPYEYAAQQNVAGLGNGLSGSNPLGPAGGTAAQLPTNAGSNPYGPSGGTRQMDDYVSAMAQQNTPGLGSGLVGSNPLGPAGGAPQGSMIDRLRQRIGPRRLGGP